MLLAVFLFRACLGFFLRTSGGGGTVYSKLSPPASISCQENALKNMPTGQVKETLSQMTPPCSKVTKTNKNIDL